jgi:hypothetical protein
LQQQQQQQQVLIHEMDFACKTAKRNKTHQKLNMFIQSSPFSDLQSGGAYDPFTKKQTDDANLFPNQHMTFATTTDVLQSINPLAQTQEKKTKDLLHICCSRIPHNNKQTIHQQRCFSSGGREKKRETPTTKNCNLSLTSINQSINQSIKEGSNQNHKNKKKGIKKLQPQKIAIFLLHQSINQSINQSKKEAIKTTKTRKKESRNSKTNKL